MIFSIRRGPDWSRNSRDSSGSYRDREDLEILGHSELGTQDTPGWASNLGWLQLDRWSTKRKQTFSSRFPVQSNPWSFHLLSALGQNPRLTSPHDTCQGKWGARGEPHCHPQSPVVTQLQWLPYLHQRVQNILWGAGSSGTAGLCFASVIVASLLQVTSLSTF